MSIYEKSRCDRCGNEAIGHLPKGWVRAETSVATDGGFERSTRRDLCPPCASELLAFWRRERTQRDAEKQRAERWKAVAHAYKLDMHGEGYSPTESGWDDTLRMYEAAVVADAAEPRDETP